MIDVGMYVRCPIDVEYPEEPREFAIGKVKEINKYSEKCTIQFFNDCYVDIKKLYGIPDEYETNLYQLERVKIRNGANVLYNNKKCVVLSINRKTDNIFSAYYIKNISDNSVECVKESEIFASFNDGDISPLKQLANYEFQQPVWFSGRNIVSRALKYIDNSYYGLRVIAGCKIFLKSYQVKTVMRCLQDKTCRNMIADEVGLGKTIEAASVLKIYINENYGKKIAVFVPDSLKGQWVTELSFKFKIYEGKNDNDNFVYLIPFSLMERYSLNNTYDFVIVDEVHRLINDPKQYNMILYISKKTDNILLLSATPIQKRKSEYYKLLKLINPFKYEKINENAFDEILESQNYIIRKVFSFFSDLDDFIEVINENDNEHNDETEEMFEDLMEKLSDLSAKVNNSAFNNKIEKIKYDSDDFGIEKMKTAVAYLCENYQLEKSVIRNRRDILKDEINVRDLVSLEYDIENDSNNAEYQVYQIFSEWIQSLKLNVNSFDEIFKISVSAFFSSSFAFEEQLLKIKKIAIPSELIKCIENWKLKDNQVEKNIENILNDPDEFRNRLVNVVDFIDQEVLDKKIVVFTNFDKTFEYYKRVFISYFGVDKCCFFNKSMSNESLELNVFRFQNSKVCNIMLSDESGGEGRNFQMADYVLHIDLPWNANQIEQRIGRLDRVGREKNKKVISVVPYAKSSLEESLFEFWNRAINIFKKSQSGLEIIMNEIDEKIVESVCDDFRYGLKSSIDEMIKYVSELEDVVKKERHFDVAAYKYGIMNNQIERAIEKYASSETKLFEDAMMGWASLAGFKGEWLNEHTVRFDQSAFSVNSAIKAKIVPPDMKKVISERMNRLRGKIINLNDSKKINSIDYIQGTFMRNRAIENDYLHFFAPGDAIFDSITSNAINSYKGRCCAVMVESDVQWTGFIFSWSVRPNIKCLLENGILPNEINLYRGFLSSEILPVYVSLENPDKLEEKCIISKFNSVMLGGYDNVRKMCEHLGSRKKRRNIMDTKQGTSYIDWFKEMYREEQWKECVNSAYEKSKEKMMGRFFKKSDLSGLKRELENQKITNLARAEFYNSKDISDEEQRKLEIIYNAFKQPEFILESVCYMRIVRR